MASRRMIVGDWSRLERENRESKQANEILRRVSSSIAAAGCPRRELDRQE
jgi:hypothetical protein